MTSKDSGPEASPRAGMISYISGKAELEEDKATDSSENVVEIRTYRRRWFIVAVLGLLVFSNSMSRIAFGPVAYTSAAFYQSQIGVINWFAIVYMVIGIPCGLLATWIMDKIGLRYSLLLASWLHCLGCILRVVSAIVAISSTGRIAFVFTGHALSATAQPFLMFAPTKVAATWFPDNQRAIANTIVTSSNPLGIMAANIISPLLVRKPEDILTMLIVYAVPAAVGALMVTFGVRTSAPPSAPSLSAEKSPEPFWVGIRQLMGNGQYWIIFLSIGGGIGIYTALTVFLEQILCPWGYTDFFAGVVCGSCLVIAGVIGALIAGIIADKTKRFVLVTKFSYILCIASVAFFTVFQNKQNQRVLVALGCALIGFFAMPLLPLGNELVVESTYPVESATSTGLVFLSGQLQGMVLVLVLQRVAKPIPPKLANITRCRMEEERTPSGIWDKPVKIRNMTTPCYVFLGYSVVICLVFVFCYQSANRRINMEKEAAERRLIYTNIKKDPSLQESSLQRQSSLASLSLNEEDEEARGNSRKSTSVEVYVPNSELPFTDEVENGNDELPSQTQLTQKINA